MAYNRRQLRLPESEVSMKRTFLALALLLLPICAVAQGPNNCAQKANPCQINATTSISATALTLASNGGLNPSFTYSWTGSPTGVTTVLQGCVSLPLKCDILDSYSGSTLVNRSIDAFSVKAPTISYDYFIVTSTWTGISTFTVTEKNMNTTKLNQGGIGGGNTTSASMTSGNCVQATGAHSIGDTGAP